MADPQAAQAAPQSSAKGATARLMGSTALGQLLALLVAPLLGRLLGPEAFGAFGVYLAVLGSIGGAASWRLGLAVPVPQDEDEATATLVAGLAATVASAVLSLLAVWAFGDALAARLGEPAAAPLFWWIPLSLIGVGATDVLSGWCLRHRDFPALVQQRVVRAVGTSGWQLVHGLALRAGAVPLVLGEVVGRVASVLAMGRAIWRVDAARLRRVDAARLRAAFAANGSFAAVATPAHLVNQLGQWMPVFLLVSWWGAAAAGLFVVGQRIIGIPIGLLGDSAGQVYTAELATQARSVPSEMPALFRRTALRLGALAAVIGLGLTAFGPLGFRLGFGEAWVDAGRMVRWQGLALAAQLVAISMAHTLVVLRYQRRQLGWDLLRLIATVGAFVLARRWGMDAVAAVALHGAVTALLYAVLIVISWQAVRARAAAPADAEATPSA